MAAYWIAHVEVTRTKLWISKHSAEEGKSRGDPFHPILAQCALSHPPDQVWGNRRRGDSEFHLGKSENRTFGRNGDITDRNKPGPSADGMTVDPARRSRQMNT